MRSGTPTTQEEWEDGLMSPSTLTTLTLQRCRSYLAASHFKHLLSILSGDSTVLEAGCGYGQNAYAFASLGYRSVGLDFSYKVLTVAQQRPVEISELRTKTAWIQGSILNLPMSPGAFDCYASFGVLEHFTKPEQERILSEAFRVLKPGGILYLSVPHFWSPWTIRRELTYWLRKFSPSHLVWQRNISKRKLRKICSAAGFKTELVQSFYAARAFESGLSIPSSISRIVPSRLNELSAKSMATLGQWFDSRNILGMGLVYVGRK